MPALSTSPWDKAVDRFSTKSVVGSRLRSAEWARMPLALREKAFFSAGVEKIRDLDAMREKLVQGLEQARPGGIGMNRARFVADMRKLLGAAPGDSGKLTDLTSVKRLELIWNFQTADANGFASHQASLDPNLLDAFPAMRLVRVEDRRVPRQWFALWGAAGARVQWQGASSREMVALRTSPIWAALSRFGRPWPPFDYNSGMGLEDVDRDETEALGLLPKGERPADRLQGLREASATAQRDWNAGLQASVRGLSETGQRWLKQTFGDQVAIDGDSAEWRSGRTSAPRIELPTTFATEAPVFTPAGTPVSKAFTDTTTGDLSKKVAAATRAIDAVHGDGELETMPIHRSYAKKERGAYHYGDSKRITIVPEADWPALTTTHEIGHVIDHQLLGVRGQFASISHASLEDFRTAVKNSSAYAQMHGQYPARHGRVQPVEFWARAYAQYIATRSGDKTLLAELQLTRKVEVPGYQWGDEDFKPIAAAIDALFKNKGWIK